MLKDVDGRSVECFLRNNGLNVLNSARQQNSGNARSGLRIVILWSFLSMEIGILGGVLFKNWETASADLFMTWRHVFTRSSSALVNPYIAALVRSATNPGFIIFIGGEFTHSLPCCILVVGYVRHNR